MITITSKVTSVQAEGVYGTIKIVGNAELSSNGVFNSIAGSMFSADERYIGSFNRNVNLSVNVENSEDAGLLSDMASAVNSFIAELQTEVEKGGVV